MFKKNQTIATLAAAPFLAFSIACGVSSYTTPTYDVSPSPASPSTSSIANLMHQTPSTEVTTPTALEATEVAEDEVITKGVTPGAFCAPHGGVGITKTGEQVTCRTSATDSRYRWR